MRRCLEYLVAAAGTPFRPLRPVKEKPLLSKSGHIPKMTSHTGRLCAGTAVLTLFPSYVILKLLLVIEAMVVIAKPATE